MKGKLVEFLDPKKDEHNIFEDTLYDLEAAHYNRNLKEFCQNLRNRFWINRYSNKNGLSLLSLAIVSKLPLDAIEALIDLAGANVVFGGNHETPLFYAATTYRSDQVKLLKSLLKRNAYSIANDDPSRLDPDRQPILVKILLNAESDTNKKSITRLLISYGADGVQPNENGISAFRIIASLAHSTGDEEYANIANEIILHSCRRKINGEAFNYFPLRFNRARIQEEWYQNIDLLTNETLERICRIPYVEANKVSFSRFEEELNRRGFVVPKNSIQTPRSVSALRIPEISPLTGKIATNGKTVFNFSTGLSAEEKDQPQQQL